MSMATENPDKAVLHYPGGEYEMDIVRATEGNDGVALGKMLAETGLTTLDPGYVNTGSTKSEITYIDGGEGILRYRGYDIADLANKATFNEVSYLLINGELPSSEELEDFNTNIRKHTRIRVCHARVYAALLGERLGKTGDLGVVGLPFGDVLRSDELWFFLKKGMEEVRRFRI